MGQNVIYRDGKVEKVEETEDPPAQYKALSRLGFLRLCQKVGGMTDEMLVSCEENPAFKSFWVKFRLASDIIFGDEDVEAGLEGLHSAGYLPNGVEAVRFGWPRE